MDTRKIHRRMALTARQARVLGRAIKFLETCQGPTCEPVRAAVREVRAAACKPGCTCSPCSKTRESGKPIPRVRATLVEAHGNPRAAALLRTAISKLKDFKFPKGSSRGFVDGRGLVHYTDDEGDGDGALKVDGDVVDRVPADSLRSDLRRKKSIKKMMSPDKGETEVGDNKFPEQTDAWNTSEEGEVPPGMISGDPVLDQQEAEDDLDDEGGDCDDDQKDAEGRRPDDPDYDADTAGFYLSEREVAPPGREKQVRKLKRTPGVKNPFAVAWSQGAREAVKAFEASAGDGMADSSSLNTPDLTADTGDGRLQPDAREVNLRYSVAVDQLRACGFCKHYRPDDESAPTEGGGCVLVNGAMRYVDVCNLFEPKSDGAKAFDENYDDD